MALNVINFLSFVEASAGKNEVILLIAISKLANFKAKIRIILH